VAKFGGYMHLRNLIAAFALTCTVSLAQAESINSKCDVSEEQVEAILLEQIVTRVNRGMNLELTAESRMLDGDVDVRLNHIDSRRGNGIVGRVALLHMVFELTIPDMENEFREVYDLVPVNLSDDGLTTIETYSDPRTHHVGLRLGWVGNMYGQTLGCRIYTSKVGFQLINRASGLPMMTRTDMLLWNPLILSTVPPPY